MSVLKMLDFEDIVPKEVKFLNNFYIKNMLKWQYFGYWL